MISLQVLFVSLCVISVNCQCRHSKTTVIGSKKPSRICSGQLIFEDQFNNVDTSTWAFENNIAGGGNGEFQWYPGYDARNAFSKNGNLHIAPTTTASIFGEKFLTSGTVNIPIGQCTWDGGCYKKGTKDRIINPIRSTRMDTHKSFAFKYGTVEIRAKMPLGDWLWPALWMLPAKSVYGISPRSGEIDISEVRGNRVLIAPWGVNVGVEQTSGTLHFGPSPSLNGHQTAFYEKNFKPGLNADFHRFKVKWTERQIIFYIDDVMQKTINVGTGFWDRDPRFKQSGLPNPWAHGTLMAPFDQEFYIILNLAVGGNGFFADNYKNQGNPKPWVNHDPRGMTNFWEKKNWWLPGWNLSSDQAHLQVDYVKVWAL